MGGMSGDVFAFDDDDNTGVQATSSVSCGVRKRKRSILCGSEHASDSGNGLQQKSSLESCCRLSATAGDEQFPEQYVESSDVLLSNGCTTVAGCSDTNNSKFAHADNSARLTDASISCNVGGCRGTLFPGSPSCHMLCQSTDEPRQASRYKKCNPCNLSDRVLERTEIANKEQSLSPSCNDMLGEALGIETPLRDYRSAKSSEDRSSAVLQSAKRPPLPRRRRLSFTASQPAQQRNEENSPDFNQTGSSRTTFELSRRSTRTNRFSNSAEVVPGDHCLPHASDIPLLQAVYTAKVLRKARFVNNGIKMLKGKRSRHLSQAKVSAGAIARPGLRSNDSPNRNFTDAINVVDENSGIALQKDTALIDQLQFVLDGIFQNRQVTESVLTPSQTDHDLLSDSLLELACLFLKLGCTASSGSLSQGRRSSSPSSTELDGRDSCSEICSSTEHSLLHGMAGPKKLLSTIVSRLLPLRVLSSVFAVLVGTILLILARSDATELLFGEPEIAVIVDAFFHVLPSLRSSSNFQSGDSNAHVPSCTQRGVATGQVASCSRSQAYRRRRRKSLSGSVAENSEDTVIGRIRSLMRDESMAELFFVDRVSDSPAAVSIMFGLALAAILESSSLARAHMTVGRRIHKVVTVLYEARNVTMAVEPVDDAIARGSSVCQPSGTVACIALEILEHATLDRNCQDRIARESKIVTICVSVISAYASFVDAAGKRPVLTSSVVDILATSGVDALTAADARLRYVDAVNAVRSCVNLTHNCRLGLAQFIEHEGIHAVVALLSRRLIWPHGNSSDRDCSQTTDHSFETYDLRVLGIALLASVAAQNESACSDFRRVSVPGREYSHGALDLALELLKDTGQEFLVRADGKAACVADLDLSSSSQDCDMFPGESSKKDDDPVKSQLTCAGSRSISTKGKPDSSPQVMENRVISGYLCLLIGALVKGSKENRDYVRSAMPENFFTGLAYVLDEFLDFHHELGIASSSFDQMYFSIIDSLRSEIWSEPLLPVEEPSAS